jgi:hypothetical protein
MIVKGKCADNGETDWMLENACCINATGNAAGVGVSAGGYRGCSLQAFLNAIEK